MVGGRKYIGGFFCRVETNDGWKEIRRNEEEFWNIISRRLFLFLGANILNKLGPSRSTHRRSPPSSLGSSSVVTMSSVDATKSEWAVLGGGQRMEVKR